MFTKLDPSLKKRPTLQAEFTHVATDTSATVRCSCKTQLRLPASAAWQKALAPVLSTTKGEAPTCNKMSTHATFAERQHDIKAVSPWEFFASINALASECCNNLPRATTRAFCAATLTMLLPFASIVENRNFPLTNSSTVRSYSKNKASDLRSREKTTWASNWHPPC